jgi:hypothetical protein
LTRDWRSIEPDCARASRLADCYAMYADAFTTEFAPHAVSAAAFAAAYNPEPIRGTPTGIAARAVVRAGRDPLRWLVDLLDQWEKVCVDEGCVLPSELCDSVPEAQTGGVAQLRPERSCGWIQSGIRL